MSERSERSERSEGMRVRPAWSAVTAVVAAALLVSGCTGSDDQPTPSGSGSAGSAGSVPAAGGSATAYPIAPSASPSPLPVIGATRDNGEWSFTLNAVRKAGPGQILVEGTLVSHDPRQLRGFEEPGYSLRKGADGKLNNTYEFSAVTITASGDATVYQPLRDSSGVCACTQGVLTLVPERPYAVYTMVTAPPSASTVTVVVQGFAGFPNITVSS